MPDEVELYCWSAEPCERRGEPVTVGVPWPRGVLRDDAHLALVGPEGEAPLQTEVLDRWPDGSVRWVLCDLLMSTKGNGATGYRLVVKGEMSEIRQRWGALPAAVLPPRIVLDTPLVGREEFRFPQLLGDVQVRYRTDEQYLSKTGLKITVCCDIIPGAFATKYRITVTNPNPAGHPGGNWDLGNDGSIDISELSVHFDAKGPFRFSPERGRPPRECNALDLFQSSSGGENWQSETHLDRNREVPLAFAGYRMGDEIGKRATPLLIGEYFALGMPEFWQNFPKGIRSDERGVSLELFPRRGLTHELQGGEQKSHNLTVARFDLVSSESPFLWVRSPLQVSCSPEWYARCEALPHLTPKTTDPHTTYLKLVDQAIEGPDTFLHKREKIDEYGWRNFGDIYGDHEAVRHPGPTPLVSHYNNQYDCVGGFAAQFFRSGDPRWFSQMMECADHTADIDIYHTTGDRAAYNGGLFWHTYHYAHADTSTHRSYPKRIRSGPQDTRVEKLDTLDDATKQKLLKAYSVGGGPAPSHVYTTGMMIAYFLTGDPRYRETVISLADYILNCEDPSKTVFRWLSREYTGLATDSQAGYHGPGRASANSVNALLDGFRLTGNRKYLDFAELLIRRVASPSQNLESLNLLNAELRWFYTMFLQALGRYLDLKIERDELDGMYAFGQSTLLHYARWMAAHERPILDTPEKLQYPTETWAAQDLRKVEVFQYAAKHASGGERERLLERAAWFFEASVNKLDSFPTKSLCRPMILTMNFGWSRNWWLQYDVPTAPAPRANLTAGPWKMFVPQKAKAMKRAKVIAMLGMVAFASVVVLALLGILL